MVPHHTPYLPKTKKLKTKKLKKYIVPFAVTNPISPRYQPYICSQATIYLPAQECAVSQKSAKPTPLAHIRRWQNCCFLLFLL